MTIKDQQIPNRSVKVRRRRVPGAIVLVQDNYYFALDEFADAVWGLCTGARTVAEIVDLMGQNPVSIRDSRTPDDTLRILRSFAEATLIVFAEATVGAS